MARLLIHVAEPPLHPTDDKINAGMFQPGHVVAIIEDWESFGTEDEGPHTQVFEAKGTPKADLINLLEDETIQVAKTYIDEETKQEVTVYETECVAARMWRAKDLAQIKMVSGTVSVVKGAELAFTQSYFERTVDVVAITAARLAQGEVVK